MLQKPFPYLIETAAISGIKYYQHRQQCNLWTVMMCLCENNQLESWQIQIGENETLRLIWLHMVHNITCAMLHHMHTDVNKNASSKNKRVYLLDLSD